MKNKALDGYIARAQPFARPILKKVRSLFHAADPRVEEVMKWGMPHFSRGGIVGYMAAFKAHAAFGVWLVSKRFTKVRSLDDLPADAALIRAVREAVARREKGETLTRARRARPEPKVPPDFAAALRARKKAKAAFDSFGPGARRDYVVWLTEAKREETRTKRLAEAIRWLSQGKKRNWKYSA